MGFLYVLGTGLVGYLLVQQFVSQVRITKHLPGGSFEPAAVL